jgi:hypothetical protein
MNGQPGAIGVHYSFIVEMGGSQRELHDDPGRAI